MRNFSPTRKLGFALTLGIVVSWAVGVCAQRRAGGGGMRGPAFHQQTFRQAAPQRGFHQSQPAPQQGQPSRLAPIVRRNPQAQGEKGEHLPQWMNQHRNLTPQQQQQALDREPGFRELPQATQQRMHNRLAQLNSMNPNQRQRTQNHIEWMEHLSVEQRAQVRGSMEQLGSLPPEQRRAVAQSFRDLRALPPEQRGAALNSPQFQYMNPAQRAALNNLLRVEPLIPPD